MNVLVDDHGRSAWMARRRRRPLRPLEVPDGGEVPDEGGPEGSILDGCDPTTLGSPWRGRTGAGNDASRDGSIVRTTTTFMRGPLVRSGLAVLVVSAAASADSRPGKGPVQGAASASRSAPETDDEDGLPRFSLPTAADRQLWESAGFRLALGLAYGQLRGVNGPPSGRLLGPILRLGLRLDRDWSMLASFAYESAASARGLSGLRFSGTIDPTWHITANVSLAIGVGFSGIVEGGTKRSDSEPLGSTLSTSYTFASAKTPLPSCSGAGGTALVRADYHWVLGPRSSTGIGVEVVGQYTACVDRTGRIDVDTAEPIVRRQYWGHVGATASWSVMWR